MSNPKCEHILLEIRFSAVVVLQSFKINILQVVNAITYDGQFVGMDTENFSHGLQAFDWF